MCARVPLRDSLAGSHRLCLSVCLLFLRVSEGKNIAPTIVLNYMMQSAKKQNKHLSLLQAYNFLGAKAPGIKVEDYFMEQLIGADTEQEQARKMGVYHCLCTSFSDPCSVSFLSFLSSLVCPAVAAPQRWRRSCSRRRRSS